MSAERYGPAKRTSGTAPRSKGFAFRVRATDGNARRSTLTGEHPFAAALLDAGFRPTPKGLRLRAEVLP